MRKLLFLLIACMIPPAAAFAQGSRLDLTAFTVSSGNVKVPAPAASIAICTQPANTSTTPCSPLATLYTDSTITIACNGANGCSNPTTADANGNAHAYISPGKYTIQSYGTGLSTFVQPDVVAPCDPSNCRISLFAGSLVSNIVSSPTGATESVNTVTITTTATCFFVTSQAVTIAGVGVAGYNGSFIVLSPGCNGTSTFSYTDPTSGLAASGGGTATGSVTFPNGLTVSGGAYSTTVPGTHTGAETFANFNRIISADGRLYPCSVAGFQSAAGAVPSTGGTIDVSACPGFPIDSNLFAGIPISKPLLVKFGVSAAYTVTASSTPPRNTTIECMNRENTWAVNFPAGDTAQGVVFNNNTPSTPTFVLTNGPATIAGCNFPGSGAGGHIKIDVNGVVIKNNAITGKQFGIEIADVGTLSYQEVVEGNFFKSTSHNISVTGTGLAPNFKFHRNWFNDYGTAGSAINFPVGVGMNTGEITNNPISSNATYGGNIFNLGSSKSFDINYNDFEPTSPTSGAAIECGNCGQWGARGNNFGVVFTGISIGSSDTVTIGPNLYGTKNAAGFWLTMNTDCVGVTIVSAPTTGVSGNCSALGSSDITVRGGSRTLIGQPLVTPTIGPSATQQHALPAVASDTIALLAAPQTLSGPKTLTSPIINGASTGTGVQGTDTKLMTAGTVAGRSTSLCTDANGGATTSGCTATGALNVSTTTVSVTNTTAETTLYSFSVLGGTLGTSGVLRLTLLGAMTSSAAPPNLTMRYKYGTAVAAQTAQTTPASVTAGFIRYSFELAATGATNSQQLSGDGWLKGDNTGQAGTNIVSYAKETTGAIDSTAAQTLAVTAQFGALDAGTTLTIRYAILERVN